MTVAHKYKRTDEPEFPSKDSAAMPVTGHCRLALSADHGTANDTFPVKS